MPPRPRASGGQQREVSGLGGLKPPSDHAVHLLNIGGGLPTISHIESEILRLVRQGPVRKTEPHGGIRTEGPEYRGLGCLWKHLRKGHLGPRRQAHRRKPIPPVRRGGPREEELGGGPGLRGG